jgi:hypothetical protein
VKKAVVVMEQVLVDVWMYYLLMMVDDYLIDYYYFLVVDFPIKKKPSI